VVGHQKRREGGTRFSERSKDESGEEGMKTDVENQSERWAVFISWGPWTPVTRYGNWDGFFSRTPGRQTHRNPSRTFDHSPRSDGYGHGSFVS